MIPWTNRKLNLLLLFTFYIISQVSIFYFHLTWLVFRILKIKSDIMEISNSQNAKFPGLRTPGSISLWETCPREFTHTATSYKVKPSWPIKAKKTAPHRAWEKVRVVSKVPWGMLIFALRLMEKTKILT